MYNQLLAKKWEGWGTALKPAAEHWILARKPLIGTVAENLEKHGVGAINIDDCRIPLNGDYKCGANGRPSQTGLGDNYDPSKANQHSEVGRFPANVIIDEESGAILDKQSGLSLSSGGRTVRRSGGGNVGSGKNSEAEWSNEDPGIGDFGGASRFFYCPKASASDRGPDCKHPTVKPTELMRYLCRLVTPPGGLIVDPFFGSGSTGRGAILESFRIIGIEGELEYCEMAKRRVKFVQDGRYMVDEAKPAKPVVGQKSIFG